MVEQICYSDYADLCKQILAPATIAYQPLTLEELVSLVQELENKADDLESVEEMIGLCGSSITIREGTVYFVH